MKEYDCYLFDADGTLIDTVELIYQCFVYTCGRFGNREVEREEVVRHVGETLRRQMERYLGEMDDERYREVADAHMAYQLSIYSNYLRAFPGVAETLARLRKQERILGVVTSRRKHTLDIYLRATGLFEWFDILITPEDTQRHKPDPEPLLAALSRLDVDAGRAVYVGDSSFDIECGVRAGLDTVFVNWSHIRPERLSYRPTFYIDNMSELCSDTAVFDDEGINEG